MKLEFKRSDIAVGMHLQIHATRYVAHARNFFFEIFPNDDGTAVLDVTECHSTYDEHRNVRTCSYDEAVNIANRIANNEGGM